MFRVRRKQPITKKSLTANLSEDQKTRYNSIQTEIKISRPPELKRKMKKYFVLSSKILQDDNPSDEDMQNFKILSEEIDKLKALHKEKIKQICEKYRLAK